MDPDLRYVLTPASFDNFEKILTAEGIKVSPTERVTHEDRTGGDALNRVILNGHLLYMEKRFAYSARNDSAGFHLKLPNANDHDPEIVESLDAILTRVFPQPERNSAATVPHLERLPDRERTTGGIAGNIACLGFMILFVGFCVAAVFFAIYGFMTFFWKNSAP